MVTGINSIVEILIPFIDTNPLLSERANHYKIFRKVSLTLYDHSKANKQLSLETKMEIVEMAFDMNKQGKRRTLTKEAYLLLLRKESSGTADSVDSY